MSNTILTIAAHPDDEILGCGGTMARHIQEGDEVHILILAEGITSRDQKRDAGSRAEELSQLKKTCKQAANQLGVDKVYLESLPDNRMDCLDILDIIKVVERYIEKIKPGVVYTHHKGDLNIDHQITNQAVMTACRPVPGQVVSELYFFEVPSATGWDVADQQHAFIPQKFVDLTLQDEGHDYLKKKINALRIYDSEMREFPHARSIETVESLARLRGASVGLNSAEAFQVCRLLKRIS